MKDQILKLIRDKRALFQENLHDFVHELEQYRGGPPLPPNEPGKIDRDIFSKMAKYHDDFSNLKNKVVSAKIVIHALSELELEIERIEAKDAKSKEV